MYYLNYIIARIWNKGKLAGPLLVTNFKPEIKCTLETLASFWNKITVEMVPVHIPMLIAYKCLFLWHDQFELFNFCRHLTRTFTLWVYWWRVWWTCSVLRTLVLEPTHVFSCMLYRKWPRLSNAFIKLLGLSFDQL